MSFGASVFWAVALGKEMVFVSGWGTTVLTGNAFAPVAAIAPPTRTANFAAMPLRNIFLSLCICIPLDSKALNDRNSILICDPNRYIFAWHAAQIALVSKEIHRRCDRRQ
jgi:hypothetical protein